MYVYRRDYEPLLTPSHLPSSLGADSSCAGCDPGSIVTDNACQPCPIATYAPFGATSCNGCEVGGGMYATAGSPFCSVAGAGKRPNAARSGVVDCGASTYSTGASDTCIPCEVSERASVRGSVNNKKLASIKQINLTQFNSIQFVRSLGAGVQRLRPAPYRRGFLQLLRAGEVRRRVHQHVRGMPRLEVLHRRGQFLHKL